MVRNYKKKTNRSTINEEDVMKAFADIKHGCESIASAARKYGLKRQTLQSRLKVMEPLHCGTDSGNSSSDDVNTTKPYQSKYTSHQVLKKHEEEELVEYVKKCALYHYGLTYSAFRKFAYEYVTLNKIACPDKWNETKEAGEDWLYGFMKRHQSLSLQTPEKQSLARLTGLTKSAAEEFYNNLKSLYDKYSFHPNEIYNLDETGVTTVFEAPKVSLKFKFMIRYLRYPPLFIVYGSLWILAEKGQRAVCQASSAERGSLITLVGIVSAGGNHLPPVYVFPRIRYSDRFLVGSYPGSVALLSKSGWMISEIFINVLKHIQRNTNCSKDRPILVILDNYVSHCSLESINYSRENGIELLSLPPHSSHRLQPLDVSVFGPFKKFCRTTFNDYLVANRGKQITIHDVAKLTNQPFQRSFSSENILSGFRASGIYPFNSMIFDDAVFALENVPKEQSLAVIQSIESNPCLPNVESINNPYNPPQTVTKEQSRSTPEAIRPISRLHAAKKSGRCGKSRLLTSSAEKKRAEALKENKGITINKRVLGFRLQKGTPASKKKKHFTADESSEESDDKISYAESIDSVGSFAENDEEEDDFLKYQLMDSDNLSLGDYVWVRFNAKAKKPVFYVGEILKILAQNIYEINYLRRASALSWVFVQPNQDDTAHTLRGDIELKLPTPTNPASTSRCRTQYIFNVDFGNRNVK